jgi:hypothetical protein
MTRNAKDGVPILHDWNTGCLHEYYRVCDIYLYEICLSSIEKERRSKRFIFILFFDSLASLYSNKIRGTGTSVV